MSNALFKAEKDGLAFLGMCTRALQQFDAPIPVPSEKIATHYQGLNIHACVVDNADGELLGLERNSIHSTDNPMEHAEQRTLRQAILEVIEKRSRTAAETVESFYRSRMFMSPGTTDGDFLRTGATCYTTLEPCPMCTSTLLVCRMKRVVYILPDPTYGGAWNHLQSTYYAKYPSRCELLKIDGTQSALAMKAQEHHEGLLQRSADLIKAGAPATHVLDACRGELESCAQTFGEITLQDLQTSDEDFLRNSLLLKNLKINCNYVHQE